MFGLKGKGRGAHNEQSFLETSHVGSRESFLSSFFPLFRVQNALVRCSFCDLQSQHIKHYAPDTKNGEKPAWKASDDWRRRRRKTRRRKRGRQDAPLFLPLFVPAGRFCFPLRLSTSPPPHPTPPHPTHTRVPPPRQRRTNPKTPTTGPRRRDHQGHLVGHARRAKGEARRDAQGGRGPAGPAGAGFLRVPGAEGAAAVGDGLAGKRLREREREKGSDERRRGTRRRCRRRRLRRFFYFP